MVTEDVRVRLLDGSLKNHPNCLAGIYKGYNLIIKQIDTGMLFSFNASSEYDKNYEAIKTFLAQKSNFVLGVIGAILGSMIGCSLWLIIYKLGYIAGIAGAAMGICAMKGYGLFGKKLDRKGVIVSAIVMLIMVFLSNRLALSWEVYDALNGYGFPTSFADIFINLGDLIKELNLTSDYYTDLVVGYALTIFCSASSICEAFSYSDSTNYSMNKME